MFHCEVGLAGGQLKQEAKMSNYLQWTFHPTSSLVPRSVTKNKTMQNKKKGQATYVPEFKQLTSATLELGSTNQISEYFMWYR